MAPAMAEGTHVAQAVALMPDAGFRHVPVVDGKGKLSGIITPSDQIGVLHQGRLASWGGATGTAA